MSNSVVSCDLAASNIVITLPARSKTFCAKSTYNCKSLIIGCHDRDTSLFSSSWRLQYDSIENPIAKSVTRSKRDVVVVYCSVPPDVPTSVGQLPVPVPNSWQAWLMGALVTIGLPFLTNKWGPLVGWMDKIKATLQTAENVAEAVEEMAEKVEKIAEDIEADLPEGKLKDALNTIENAAEEIAKDADQIDNLIDKVQEMEEKVEDMIEEGNEIAKDIKQT